MSDSSLVQLALAFPTASERLLLALLVIVMVKFNAKANPVPSKTTHNTFIEIIESIWNR